MAKFTLLKTGVVGTILTALCCFTPVLLLLGVGGVVWVVGYLDYVLIPALLLFSSITLYAVYRLRCAKC